MSIVRMGRCASCGTPVLWLRAWGFGEPRPLELHPQPDGEVVIEPDEARHRVYALSGNGAATAVAVPHRYRLHWPCPAVTPRATNGHAPPLRTGTRDVAIVPHTHWDREWYSPFQTFRLRLVHVVDRVLDVLDDDPSFAHFLLDGQTAMVDDYLEVRPEAEPRIRRLAMAGRLSLGPWHTQPDEFLVSGETLVRNLQQGIARSTELGGTMEVGYLPDSFGHAAQMPQLLRRAGIDHAVVFRGLPDSVASTAFWWEAPDGSRVRAEHLPFGYTNAYRLVDDADALSARAHDLDEALNGRRVGDLLLMNGGDHEFPREWLGRVVTEANRRAAAADGASGDGYRFVITGLQEYVERQPTDGLPTWRGELRASGPSTVTMGVASNRVDVKLAAAAAERAVERRGEPLSALFLPIGRYPDRLLRQAWRRLIDNAAHDSACACSADDVVDQVLLRYAEARQVGDGLAAEAVASLAARVDAPAGSLLVVNPSSHVRSGTVRFDVPGTGELHLVGPDGSTFPVQVLGVRQPTELTAETTGREAGIVVDLVGRSTFAGHPVSRWRADGTTAVRMEMARAGDPLADLSDFRAWLLEWADAHPDDLLRVVLLQPPVRDVVAAPGPVPGFGWTAYRVEDGPAVPTPTVTGGDGWIANDHVRVDVDRERGTLTVTTADGLRLEGINRYVDGGDAGDTYNWSPPADDHLVDLPDAVDVTLVEAGPVRARLVVLAMYPWGIGTQVRTTVDLVAGEPFVRVEASFVNAHPDHRLRAHFPLPSVVAGSDAECAFAVVHRGLVHAGNPIEAGLATYPARRFVDCSDGVGDERVGLALVHDGVGEYEVVGGGTELALTLLRTVGYLSREDGSLRPVGAGPQVAIPHAQQLGPFRRSYAIVLHRGAWADADLPARADDVLLPLEHAWVGATSREVAPAGARLTVDGAEVTAVIRENDGIVVRLVRMADTAAHVDVRWDGAPARAWQVNLRGHPIEPVDGGLGLGPWEIATLRLLGT